MPTRNNEAMLTRAPAGRHLCQFHHDPEKLSRAVSLFAGTGLHRGDGVVIVATPEHTALFLRDLERMEIDASGYQVAGALVLLDAEETLAQFMRGEMPDWNRFRQAIASVLESVGASSRGATRAYGEMVSVLWRQGNTRGAIRLEEYWNELNRSHPFTLFCGYMLDGLEGGSYDGPIHEIGRTHTDILPTEDDERLRAAIDAASEDLLGISFSLTLSFSGREQSAGEHRLPIGRRTMLWLQRNMPGSSGMILERARHYYRQFEGRVKGPALRLSR